MRVDLVGFEWYVPEYGGNRERARSGEDPEPFEVQLKPASWADQQKLNRRLNETGKPETEEDRKEYWLGHVGEVRGFFVGDEKVTTAERLWELGPRLPWEVMTELVNALWSRGRLEDGLKKKLSSPPGSFDSIRKTDGTAPSA